MIIETFRQALQNVWSNKLRTFLTMLGIIIGVMAVIVIVGLGNGMTQSMRDSFSALGTNALSIQVWGYGSRTASVEDVYKIADKNKELISAVSPQIDFSNNTPKVGTTTYRYGTSVYGVDEHYTEMKNYTLAQGRGLQYMDIKDNKQVCIIGDSLNRAAYGGNAVGQTIKLGAYKFRIVGEKQHEFFRNKAAAEEERRRDQHRFVDTQAENFAHLSRIPLAPILRTENADAADNRAEQHVLHELNLSGERNRRHRILADPSEHDRIGRRDKREHEVLQSDRESQPEQLPVEHLIAEQLFHIHICSIPSRLFAFHLPLPTPNSSDGIDVEDTPGNPFVKPKANQVSTI